VKRMTEVEKSIPSPSRVGQALRRYRRRNGRALRPKLSPAIPEGNACSTIEYSSCFKDVRSHSIGTPTFTDVHFYGTHVRMARYSQQAASTPE